jgi:hypothetical protein
LLEIIAAEPTENTEGSAGQTLIEEYGSAVTELIIFLSFRVVPWLLPNKIATENTERNPGQAVIEQRDPVDSGT